MKYIQAKFILCAMLTVSPMFVGVRRLRTGMKPIHW